MFRTLCQSIAERIPSQCAVCGRWPTAPVCEACVAQFAQPCRRCTTCAIPLGAPAHEKTQGPPLVFSHPLGGPGEAWTGGAHEEAPGRPQASLHPLGGPGEAWAGGALQCGACLRAPPPLDACLAGLHYAYPWSTLIVQFKFHAQSGWARSFALLLRSVPWVEPALEQADLVVPMPLSTQRLQTRGFNQALELAGQLAPDKLARALLLRIRDHPPQSALGRAERMRNVRGAFAIEPLRAAELQRARVVLVDDVMTSGASMFSAAATLRQAGASHVTGLVLARADPPGEPRG